MPTRRVGIARAMPTYGSITAFLPLRGDFFSALGGALTGFDSEAALRVALRALAGARALPPRARLASNRPTASSSVIVSGVRWAGSVALTPSWVA